jgi:hypothetical protein
VETYCLQSIAYAVHNEKIYENIKEIFSYVIYKTYQWHICGDLKVTASLMGLQKGYTNSVVSYAYDM